MQSSKPLSSLLVLCPTAHHLAYLTEVTIDQLCEAGAIKLRSNGNSCVAMHRCQLAGKAERVLDERQGLEYVLWLDGDMVVPASIVEQLVTLVRNLASIVPLERTGLGVDARSETVLEARRRCCPAISGAYVKRNAPQYFALQRLLASPGEPAASLCITTRSAQFMTVHELIPVVAGMGALCQTREAFLQHIAESKCISAGSESYPAITASGPALNVRGEMAWGSEDWTYCSWEWQYGRGVYLASHLHFGHVGEQIHWPSESTTFAE